MKIKSMLSGYLFFMTLFGLSYVSLSLFYYQIAFGEESSSINRTDRPFTVQLSTGGEFSPIPAPGPTVGVHVGYQISEAFYIGGTSKMFFDMSDTFDKHDGKGYDENEVYGQSAEDDSEFSIGPRHHLAVRVSPWDHGLFFSAGIIYQGRDTAKTTFRKRERELNDNTYTTGLIASLEYEAWTVPAIGIGFNHIFTNGISIGVDGAVGLAKPQSPDVTVDAINWESEVAQEDLDYWKEQIEDNEKRFPAQVAFHIGYAF